MKLELFKAVKRAGAVSAIALLCGAVNVAHAEIIDFEDIASSARDGFNNLGIQNTYQGYQWSATAGQGSGQWGIASNTNTTDGQQAYAGVGYGWTYDGARSMFIDFGAEKDVTGAFFSANFSPNFNASTVQFFGYDGIGNLLGSSGVLNLVQNQWQFLAANLNDITKLEIRSDAEQKWYAIDNLELNRSTDVPEPASLALFGIGLAGLGMIRRRRKM